MVVWLAYDGVGFLLQTQGNFCIVRISFVLARASYFSMLFTVSNHTAVRFSYFRNHAVRCGVLHFWGIAWCGAAQFSRFRNQTVRRGAFFSLYHAVWCGLCLCKNHTVRCGIGSTVASYW